MNLTKKMKEVCTEKDKMVLKETKEDMNKTKKKKKIFHAGRNSWKEKSDRLHSP